MARRRGSHEVVAAAGVRSVRHTTSRAVAYAPPWLVWLSLPTVALMFWLLTVPGKAAAMLVASSLSLGGAVLAAFTWHVYGRREPSVRVHATVFVGGAALWVLAACTWGLFRRPDVQVWPEVWRVFEWLLMAFNPPVWGTWLVCGFVGCLTWSIRRVSQPPEAAGERPESPLEKVLAGARLSKTKEIDGQVVAQLEANRGEQTIADLQASVRSLEVALGVRPGAARITPNPDDAGRGTLTLVPTDPLRGEIVWPGPSAPGASIADAPVPIGVYEDGQTAAVWLCGDDDLGRALAHWLIMGMNGAGKSQGWVVAMTDALTRCDFELQGSDHVKGKQTFGPLLGYMSKVATTAKEARQLIAEARDEASRRQADFGERGIKQWAKGCGYPLLMVWIEEAAEIVDDSESFIRLVERARSAGVVIVASLQRASHDNIETSARAQLAASLCFGVRDAMDATFALPDTVLDAGAAPDSWGNRRPGYCYLVAPGVDEERWHVPLRTFRARDPQIEAALAEHGHATAPLPAGQPLPAAQADDDDQEDEELAPMPPELDPELDVNPDEPIAPPSAEENLPFVVPQAEKLSTLQAQAVVQQHLRTLLADGRTHTRPVDVGNMKPRTTRSREWVRQELKRLCSEAGPGEIALEQDDSEGAPGVFRMVVPVPAEV